MNVEKKPGSKNPPRAFAERDALRTRQSYQPVDTESLRSSGSAGLQSLDRQALGRLVWRFPRKALGQHLGVSDTSIRKRCKRLNVVQPPQGYWSRIEAGHEPIAPEMIPAEWRADALIGARNRGAGLSKLNPCELSAESPLLDDQQSPKTASHSFGSYVAALSWGTLSTDQLRSLVWAIPVVGIAVALDVSDVMILKRCKRNEIKTPPRGYWNRIIAGQPIDESAMPADLVRYARRCAENYVRRLPVLRPPGKLSEPLLQSIEKWLATLPEPSRVARRSHLKSCLLTAEYSTLGDVQAMSRPALKLLARDLEGQYAASTASALKGALKKYRGWLVHCDAESVSASGNSAPTLTGVDALFDGSPRSGEDPWISLRDAAMMSALFLGDATVAEICGASQGKKMEKLDDRAKRSIKRYLSKLPVDMRDDGSLLFLTTDGDGIYRKLVERVIGERTERALGRRLTHTELRALLKLRIPLESLATWTD